MYSFSAYSAMLQKIVFLSFKAFKAFATLQSDEGRNTSIASAIAGQQP